MKEIEFESKLDKWINIYWTEIRPYIDTDEQDDYYDDWIKELKEEMMEQFKKFG